MGELSSAILEARKNMQMPPLNGVGHAGKGGSREYRYATLQDVLKCVMPPLMERGVLLTQGFEEGDLVTRAVKGDESMVLDRRHVNMSGTSQEQGSAETYAKRYALCSVFCIAGMEDDDGQAASVAGTPLDRAKHRLWAALTAYGKKNGRDPEDVLGDVRKRPEWESQQHSAEWLEKVASDYEELCRG